MGCLRSCSHLWQALKPPTCSSAVSGGVCRAPTEQELSSPASLQARDLTPGASQIRGMSRGCLKEQYVVDKREP